MLERDRAVGVDGRQVGQRVAGHRHQVDRRPVPAGGPGRGGPAAAGPRRAGPCGRPRPRCGAWPGPGPRAVPPPPGGTARRSPGWWSAGVRSSWLASATKRRSRSSEADRSAKAVSIWLSMAFRARPSRPISVSGSAGSTRRERSPPAMSPAVAAMRSSGSSPSRTTASDRQGQEQEDSRRRPPARCRPGAAASGRGRWSGRRRTAWCRRRRRWPAPASACVAADGPDGGELAVAVDRRLGQLRAWAGRLRRTARDEPLGRRSSPNVPLGDDRLARRQPPARTARPGPARCRPASRLAVSWESRRPRRWSDSAL